MKVLGRGSKALLADLLAVKDFLEQTVMAMGWIRTEAHVTQGLDTIAGAVVLPDAHVAIHVDYERAYFVCDVYSGQGVYERFFEVLELALKSSFGAYKIMTSDMSNSLEYFDDV